MLCGRVRLGIGAAMLGLERGARPFAGGWSRGIVLPPAWVSVTWVACLTSAGLRQRVLATSRQCGPFQAWSPYAQLQATALGDASASAAAWCLSAHVDEALGRTTAVRDGLYGSLLAALRLRLAEVSSKG